MSEQDVAARPGACGLWLRAVRAFSFTASLMPVVVGAMLALSYEGRVLWGLFPLVAAASVLFHAGTNLVSDAGDFTRGLDREGSHGGSGLLVAGLLTPAAVFRAGVLMFVLGSILGLIMVWFRGLPLLWLGLAGLAGGFFYGGKPFGYKYHALGDVMVFMLMGPLMVAGSYFVLTGSFHVNVLYVSVPVGCLVTAILCSNNLRDIVHDSRARVRTMANVLGPKAAKIEYFLLVCGAFAAVAAMAIAGVVGPWCLLVLLSLPPAVRNMTMIARAHPDRTAEIASIDVRTAQLHLLFGVLLSVGLLVSAVT